MNKRKPFTDRAVNLTKGAEAPRTTPGDKRSFDMRPKPSNYVRREDPRDRAIRPRDDTPEKLLDPDPSA